MSIDYGVEATVNCDGGCNSKMMDGAHVYCEDCRTLPDGHTEARDVADGLRDWTTDNRHDLTDTERVLLERVSDAIERGYLLGRSLTA